MSKDIQKADIERYALGLTSSRETARIERAMEEQPELRQLVEEIQQDLFDYAERIQIPPLPEGTTPNPNRFSELDEEMLDVISHQNDRLRRWLVAASVLLLIVASASIYLFVQNGEITAQLKQDRAQFIQEINYKTDHLTKAKQQIHDWKSAAHFTTKIPVTNVQGAWVSLYTFEHGEKVMLNVAALPNSVHTLAVWDESRPGEVMHHFRCDAVGELHYIDLAHRDQINRLKISSVSEADMALFEKERK